MGKLCHLKNNGGVIHSLICPHHPPFGAHVRVHSFFYRKVNTNKINQTCQVGQQSKKPRRKLKLCLAALSTAASYVITGTISTSSTMWQPEGINYSVPSFTIFCLLLSIAVPSIITTIHFLLSFTVPSQLLVPPLLLSAPLLFIPARHCRFLEVHPRSSRGNHGPSAVSSRSPPSSARCWRWRARMNGVPPPISKDNANQKESH